MKHCLAMIIYVTEFTCPKFPHCDFFLGSPFNHSKMSIEISCHYNCQREGNDRDGCVHREFRARLEQRGEYEGLDVVGVALFPDADAIALTVAPRQAVVEGEVAAPGAALVGLRDVVIGCQGR